MNNNYIDLYIEYTINEYIKKNPYWMKDLLCILNNNNINIKQFIEVVKQKEINVQQTFLYLLSQVSIVLSINKQKQIETIMKNLDYKFSINYPVQIINALNILNIKDNNTDNKNYFELVDIFCNVLFNKNKYKSIEDNNNPWISLLNWFNNNNKFSDYNKLKSIIPLVSDKIRLLILKRYIHDIRLKNTSTDTTIIQQFKTNDLEKYIRYRNCLFDNNKINITVQLIADCILTILKSHGQVIQEFNGVLDIAIQNCNTNNPDIDFGFDSFLPLCKGGIMKTKNIGFVEYEIICYVDNEKLIDKVYLENIIYKILKKCYAQDNNELWIFKNNEEYIKAIQLFYPNKLEQNEDNLYFIYKSNISIPYFQNNICNLINKNRSKSDKNKIKIHSSVHSKDCMNTWILTQFVYPNYVNIYPAKKLIFGIKYDIFDILKNISHSNNSKTIEDLFNENEAAIIHNLIINELHNDKFPENLSFNYDKKLFELLKNKYGRFLGDSNDYFRIVKNYNKNKYYCAPLSSKEGFNDILKLHFLWCNGNICFKYGLKDQTVSDNTNWSDYTLYHISEIIGYPTIEHSGQFLEVKDNIRTFINIINRISDIFEHMKCKQCKHILFPCDNGGNFNNYTRFHCLNKQCPEFKKEIYINHCYNCSLIIDSRNTNKCTNGKYICPHCLSCCNDETYKTIAIKFINENKKIPSSINNYIGKGHNNKGIFFCYNCKIELQEKENGYRICPICNNKYNI